MIEFDNVKKTYADSTVAIENVSFEVAEGTTTVLVGPSGCGKTTTMKLVNRLEDPTEGTVYYDGTDTQAIDVTELRRDIGYVIQEIGLFNHMTVGENVATVPKLKGWDADRIDDRVDELLELMALPPTKYRDQYPRELSGGQRQRVGVARALAADPDVLLMDEPFGALDPITRADLQDEFLEIQAEINTTILFVTHSIDEALKMGDKIAIFDVGELVQYDTPRNILEDPNSEFVRDFVGDDVTLKKLSLINVEEIMQSPDTNDTAANHVEQTVMTSGGEIMHQLDPDDSLKSALSMFVESDVQSLPVVRDGGIIGIVDQDDVFDLYNGD
ncbi:ABC transporter related protein (plasmid) [Haloterrigena turkmenica DSM 5511]|uniref:Molybdate/tungstate import ATP-binding protein WtpC n=1 Tax=Haloterrigena turkmenica (strain ATCC 51198 / DSM 5511 / JCM 9101 / NCIMB 13204 / VKM B-1734 / 4k) TaxID=543526 RepID=D2S2D1_HALTV|nr:ABC transporter ATP-binding protein [Haloterrigena turkmenica]ADB63528.1 ABC transporter related protein [Haloterrigena turkmenica DSM 5511]